MRNPFARKPSPVPKPEPVETRHLAMVDLRTTGEYFVTTYSFDQGLAILDGPPVVLPSDATAEDLGTETLAALLRSSTIVAPANLRTDPVPSSAGLLARAKVKTHTGYMRGTKSVDFFAEFDGDVPDEIEITPQQKVGGRGGREPITDKRFTISYSTPEVLGAAILTSLDFATA